MQLGKKSKTLEIFERVKGDFGSQAQEVIPLTTNLQNTASAERNLTTTASTASNQDAVCVTIAESISVKLTREGSLKSFNIKGDLQLRITDSSLTKVKLDLLANPTHNAQFRTHPGVDKALFNRSKAIQLKDSSKGFPINNSVGVLRWSASIAPDVGNTLPITLTVWTNKGSDASWNITIEYELMGVENLRDVTVTIPYSTSEPVVSSYDAIYEVSGDSLDWMIGTIDESNATGNLEFEAQAENEAEFFPINVSFSRSRPYVDIDVCCPALYYRYLLNLTQVTSVKLVDMDEDLPFTKDVRCGTESYSIE